MNSFRLVRATIEGDHKPTWLLFLPGRHHEAVIIADGNMRELVEQWREQGGALEPITNTDESPTK